MIASAAAILLGCAGGTLSTLPGTEAGADAEAAAVSATAFGGQLTAAAEAFDGEQAMEHARQIVAIGPRPVGSEALERTRAYIEEALAGYGIEVRRDAFTADTPRGPIEMANLIVDLPAAAGAPEGPVILVTGHYDTAQFPGIEFVGANDAGSSAAILIEIARVLHENPPPLPVRVVFFDGEEAVITWQPGDNTYGSRYMAERLQQEGTVDRIGAMILLDMIGDAGLAFKKEWNSTPWLTDLVWETAHEIGHGAHFTDSSIPIEDDHIPFKNVGVPVIDLIDFDYGPGNRYWHSPMDTIDKLGAGSFQVVGEVVLAVLPALAERLGSGS